MSNQDNYQTLIGKLDQFIRKFYVNKLIRGAFYFVALVLALFLIVNFMEHEFYFGTGMRKVLFYSFIGISGLSFFQWIAKPILQYFRLGSVISHDQAADIIGNHFSTVDDKLLNILQLKRQEKDMEFRALIDASINKKSREIQPIPFRKAINLAKNRKYLRYALPPLLLLLVLLFAAPSLIKDSTNRLINNGKEFFKPAPFHFLVEKEDLSVVQFEDFPLSVEVTGDELPNEVFIDIDDYQYRLTKEAPNIFTYRFSNVQKAMDFRLFSIGVKSEKYTLEVLEKPNILGFEVMLDFPNYTQRTDEQLASIGDLVVPQGTRVDWVFNAQNTDEIKIRFSGHNEALEEVTRFDDELFTFKKQVMKDQGYKLYVANEKLPNADSLSYTITVIPDLYPNIQATKFQDSTDAKMLYFVGDASDDYGLLSLTFNYQMKKGGVDVGQLNTIMLPKPANKQVQFDHVFDVNELELGPGDEVVYYFEIHDNDAVNGSKSARTDLMAYAVPTLEEFEAMAEENDDKIKNDLLKAMKESQKVQKEMKELREELLQEKNLDWQSRKELEKLLEKQKALQKQIEEAKEAFEENLKNQEQFDEMDEELLEKQEKVQELFEQVMSEEMQELMEQIEEMLQELEKEDALEMMEEFEFNDEELEKELDRLLELFKQLELEQEMKESIEKLEELAEEQEELSEKTEEGEESQEELEEKQEEINEKFEDIKEQIEDIEKKNEALENPKDMENQEQQLEDIEEQLENSQKQLEQQENKKASESQKKAAGKMKEMANQMEMQMQAGQMEQMMEDMASLRQLLENLVGLSFDQEDLMAEFGKTSINTPRYVELTQQQFKIKDDFKLVEDSLQELSKRVFQIESFVTEKVSEIKGNLKASLEDLEERQKPQAGEHQQRTMKNVNDLALMLSEVMNQMQQQMSSMMPGNQMCDKPGGKPNNPNGPKDKMSQGQEQLNKQMQQMRDQLKNGEKGSSQDFAKMAAKQAALRKALQEKQRKKQEQGKGKKELQELIEKMDQTETELVNKKLTNEMIKRQQDILTRMLEHEEAERERELDRKRKAEQATQKERKLPPSLEEYIKKREAEIEMYNTVSPTLKPYYKFLVEQYFKSLKDK